MFSLYTTNQQGNYLPSALQSRCHNPSCEREIPLAATRMPNFIVSALWLELKNTYKLDTLNLGLFITPFSKNMQSGLGMMACICNSSTYAGQ